MATKPQPQARPAAITPYRQLTTLLQAPETQRQLALACRAGMTPELLARVALTTISKSADLQACTPRSVLASLSTCAAFGFEPGIQGFIYLVPYGKECTAILGYKGMVQLAYRSGQVKAISCQVVHAVDEFIYNPGDPLSPLYHRPTNDWAHRGAIVGAYATAALVTGGNVCEYMPIGAIESVRDKYAKGTKRSESPWNIESEAMFRKTVFRRLAKWIPSSVELQMGVALDEMQEKSMRGVYIGGGDVPMLITADNEPAEYPQEQKQEKKTPTAIEAEIKAGRKVKAPSPPDLKAAFESAGVPVEMVDETPIDEMTDDEAAARIGPECEPGDPRIDSNWSTEPVEPSTERVALVQSIQRLVHDAGLTETDIAWAQTKAELSLDDLLTGNADTESIRELEGKLRIAEVTRNKRCAAAAAKKAAPSEPLLPGAVPGAVEP